MDFGNYKHYMHISHIDDCSCQELQHMKEIIGNSCKQINDIITNDNVDNCEIFKNVSLNLSYHKLVNTGLITSIIENEAEGKHSKITQYSINSDELIIELVESQWQITILCFVPKTKDYISFEPGYLGIVYNNSQFHYEPFNEDKYGIDYSKKLMSNKDQMTIKEIVNSFLDFITNHDFKTKGMFD